MEARRNIMVLCIWGNEILNGRSLNAEHVNLPGRLLIDLYTKKSNLRVLIPFMPKAYTSIEMSKKGVNSLEIIYVSVIYLKRFNLPVQISWTAIIEELSSKICSEIYRVLFVSMKTVSYPVKLNHLSRRLQNKWSLIENSSFFLSRSVFIPVGSR